MKRHGLGVLVGRSTLTTYIILPFSPIITDSNLAMLYVVSIRTESAAKYTAPRTYLDGNFNTVFLAFLFSSQRMAWESNGAPQGEQTLCATWYFCSFFPSQWG